MEDDVNPMPEETLSQYICQVMELTGASTQIRDLHKQCASAYEIIQSVAFNDLFSMYVGGSVYEGTSLLGMGSDIDLVQVLKNLEVITSLHDCLQNSLLLIQDDLTPPGYCKLQPVFDGVSVDKFYLNNSQVIQARIPTILDIFKIETDESGRLLCGHPLLEQDDWPTPMEIHGPALHAAGVKYKIKDADLVYAFRCRRLPKEAMQWFKRKRPVDWPPQEIIEKCRSLGFFVVPVGHPNSLEKDKQWRISLSLQERMLVTMFNSIQLKCFVLMKVLKNEVINKKIGKEVLTSYYCKTCLLYMIETLPKNFWFPSNLLKCLTICLEKLCEWAKERHCPNYFIPQENMFDKLDSRDLELLATALEALLADAFVNVLLRVNTNGIGKDLQFLLSSYKYLLPVDFILCEVDNDLGKSQRQIAQNIMRDNFFANFLQILTCQLTLISDIVAFHSRMLIDINRWDLEKVIESLRSYVSEFESVTKVTEHSEEETKAALSLFMLVSVEIALLERTGATKQEMRDILRGKMRNAFSLPVDFLPLKKASNLFVLGYPEDSVKSLRTIPEGVRFSICRCDLTRLVPETFTELIEYLARKIGMIVDITIKNVIRKWIFTCVPFLPVEAHITPSVIMYECLRCLCQLPWELEKVGPKIEQGYNVAFVDGQLLYPFLLYSNHSQMNCHDYKLVDILLMNAVVNTRTISHKASCLNIFGWVLNQEGLKSKALDCFIQSIQEEHERNAAYWHLLFLICELK